MQMGEHVNFTEHALLDVARDIPVRHHRPIASRDLTGIAQANPELDDFGLGVSLGGQTEGAGVAPNSTAW